MSIIEPSWDELGNAVRRAMGIPGSKEPLPDLKVEMEKPAPGDVLFKPVDMLEKACDSFTSSISPAGLGGWTSYRFQYNMLPPMGRSLGTFWYGDEPQPLKPDSAPFELNMMEALVGWRAWKLDLEKKALRSQNTFFGDDEKHLLRPGTPMTAYCGRSRRYAGPSVADPAGVMLREEHPVPAEFCTCGIYAKDTLEEVIDDKYEGIYGQVYGWGRYVRGDQGWRAQYMYPKRFYLTRNYAREISPETIDFLKTYRVPIFVEQPCLFYNPEEDGYEYRDNEENWNFGADPEPDTDEDYGS